MIILTGRGNLFGELVARSDLRDYQGGQLADGGLPRKIGAGSCMRIASYGNEIRYKFRWTTVFTYA
jgi:hypothetical protein